MTRNIALVLESDKRGKCFLLTVNVLIEIGSFLHSRIAIHGCEGLSCAADTDKAQYKKNYLTVRLQKVPW